jgi:hypothetical protein
MIFAGQEANMQLVEYMLSEAGYPGITAKKFLNHERFKC